MASLVRAASKKARSFGNLRKAHPNKQELAAGGGEETYESEGAHAKRSEAEKLFDEDMLANRMRQVVSMEAAAMEGHLFSLTPGQESDVSSTDMAEQLKLQTMNDFVYRNDSPDKSIVAEVPDGRYTLQLYQTNPLSEIVDENAIGSTFRIQDTSTIPDRDQTVSDFFYGDAREMMSTQASNVKVIDDYCSIDPVGKESTFCKDKYALPDFEIKSLASYGLKGTVTMKGTDGKFVTLADIKLCGINTVNGSLGVNLTSNVDGYAAVGTPCSPRRKLIESAESNKETMDPVQLSEWTSIGLPKKLDVELKKSDGMPGTVRLASDVDAPGNSTQAKLHAAEPRMNVRQDLHVNFTSNFAAPPHHSSPRGGSEAPWLANKQGPAMAVQRGWMHAPPGTAPLDSPLRHRFPPASLSDHLQNLGGPQAAGHPQWHPDFFPSEGHSAERHTTGSTSQAKTGSIVRSEKHASASALERDRRASKLLSAPDVVYVEGSGEISFTFSEGYPDFSNRWWIIKPVGNVQSITLDITFLAVERGFDFVTIFSCPNGGACTQLQRYSDYDYASAVKASKWPYKWFKFFTNKVSCGSIQINTNEIRVRFESDGPAPKETDTSLPSSYLGFNATYLSSDRRSATEVVGCPLKNTTLTGASGSVFAYDSKSLTRFVVDRGGLRQMQSRTVPIDRSGYDELYKIHPYYPCHPSPGNMTCQWACRSQLNTFWGGYSTDFSPACDAVARLDDVAYQRKWDASNDVRRGVSQWWTIAPSGDGLTTPKKIEIAIREVLLDDTLDVLNIYTRTGGVTSLVKTISGYNPLRGHDGIPKSFLPSSDPGRLYNPDGPCNSNGICEATWYGGRETIENCPNDCPCNQNGICDKDEGPGSDWCWKDCECDWNSICGPKEKPEFCPYDCRASVSQSPTPQKRNVSSPLAPQRWLDNTLACNKMVLTADEVWIELKTSEMPTNSSGFWLEFFAESNSMPLETIPSPAECADTTRVVTIASEARSDWSTSDHCLKFGSNGLMTVTDVYSHGKILPHDGWGVAPNGRIAINVTSIFTGLVGTEQVSSRAGHLEMYAPDTSFESRADFWRLYSCKSGNCTQLYRTLTGWMPRDTNSFCPIRQNTHTFRIEMDFDSTVNSEGYIDQLCWRAFRPSGWLNVETMGNCKLERFTTQTGNISRAMNRDDADLRERVEYLISPGTDTKSITLDFRKYSVFWDTAVSIAWNCDANGDSCTESTSQMRFDVTRGYERSQWNLQKGVRGPWSSKCWAEYAPSGGVPDDTFRYTGKLADRVNLWDCYMAACWDTKAGTGYSCYSPPPTASMFTFATSALKIIVYPSYSSGSAWPGGIAEGIQIVYNSSKTVKPDAVVDGDCRLQAKNADNRLNSATGSIMFDAAAWMKTPKVPCMGHGISASRVRWVIRPPEGTKQITLSFSTLDLDKRRDHDVLYLLKDCDQTPATVNHNWASYSYQLLQSKELGAFVLNGQGGDPYGRVQVPCNVTFHTSCMVVELDMSRRFVPYNTLIGSTTLKAAIQDEGYEVEELPDYSKELKGFIASYTSSTVAPSPSSQETQWRAGGISDSCLPAFLKKPPTPVFKWNTLCCSKIEGNEIFEGNFWGNLSIDAQVPADEPAEDYKVVYMVREFDWQSFNSANQFNCEDSQLKSLDGWYPTEATPQDKINDETNDRINAFKKQYPQDDPTEFFFLGVGNDGQTSPQSVGQGTRPSSESVSGKLWVSEKKTVMLRGKLTDLHPSSILLNPRQPSYDRQNNYSWHGRVMLMAATCKAYRVSGTTIWMRSDLAFQDQIFSTGPSLTLKIRLSAQPLATLKLGESQAKNIIERNQWSDPNHYRISRDIAKQIEAILGITETKVGNIDRVAATDISIEEVEQRRTYKTSVVTKPGWSEPPADTPAPTPAHTPAPTPAPGQSPPKSMYDVNLTMSILCNSISEVSSFSRVLSSSQRRIGGGTLQQIVSSLPPGTQSYAGGSCRSHYDCIQTNTVGLFCSVRKKCEACRFCGIDKLDSIDGSCPRQLCPLSGGIPECLSSNLLAKAEKPCNSSYSFEVWRYQQSPDKNVVPIVQPPPKTKAKYATPFNRLVGAIMVTQYRKDTKTCAAGNIKVQSFVNATRAVCQAGGDKYDATPFGLDPTFQRFSDVYNGKLNVESIYFKNERVNDANANPLAFFPHQYDPLAGDGAISSRSGITVTNSSEGSAHEKDPKRIHGPSRNLFKIYFDELPTGLHADNMLKFLVDGKFIDSHTDKIMTELVTYNADNNLFTICRFSFDWQRSGRIKWDYSFNSIDVTPYSGSTVDKVRIALEAILLIFFAANVVGELIEFATEIVHFRTIEYLTNPFNMIDWVHFLFMALTAVFWGMYWTKTSNFDIPASFRVLLNPTSDVRPFLTDADQELAFLQFFDQLVELSDVLTYYSSFAGIAVVLFLLRLLKALDFQERMGLVTKTVQEAAGDLFHFVVLFLIVFVSYACVGSILFGHQLESMSTLTQACMTLMIIVLGLDTTQFWQGMNHASTTWAMQLFLWSYMVIVFFILLNIFLAILVDAYATVKARTLDSVGLVEELSQIIQHDVKSAILPSKSFVSDSVLRDRLHQCQVQQADELDKQRGGLVVIPSHRANELMGNKQHVLLEGGSSFGLLTMAKILSKSNVVMDDREEGIHRTSSDEDRRVTIMHLQHNKLVFDVMARYGDDAAKQKEKRSADWMMCLEFEGIKRQLAMMHELRQIKNQLLHGDVHGGRGHLSEEITRLSVRVAQAEDLPSMDVISGVDAYSVLNIENLEEEIYATKVVVKVNNPVWNADFQWHMPDGSRFMTVSVVDHDKVTDDDVIGCIYIDLRTVPLNTEVDKWYPVVCARTFRGNHKPRVRIIIRKSMKPGSAASSPALRSIEGIDKIDLAPTSIVLGEVETSTQAASLMPDFGEAQRAVPPPPPRKGHAIDTSAQQPEQYRVPLDPTAAQLVFSDLRPTEDPIMPSPRFSNMPVMPPRHKRDRPPPGTGTIIPAATVSGEPPVWLQDYIKRWT